MTTLSVKALIEQLQQFPQDLPVFLEYETPERGWGSDATDGIGNVEQREQCGSDPKAVYLVANSLV